MEVKPFRAFRFDPRVVGDVGKCIAPPYDVISDAEREVLYRRSEHNIVRITRGKTTPSDNGQHNQYTRAAEFLHKWIAEGVLKPDDKDTIYGYVQDFELDGVAYRRLTFIALGKLEEFGKIVRPHEQVFAKPVQDRLNLKKATAAQFGLVFMLYDDPQGVADKAVAKAAANKPLVDFVDDHGVRHQLFAITDQGDMQAITEMMADKSVIIADGHHRYTTGLTYMRESGIPAAKYQMLAFTNTAQKGLVVLATHRVVGGIDGFNWQDLVSRLIPGFTVMKIGSKLDMLKIMKTVHEKDETPLGIYLGDGRFCVAVLKDKSLMKAAAPDKSEAWQTLDVAVLQKLILEGILGLDEEKMGNSEYVEYVKDMPNAIDEIIRQIDSGRKQVAFFTNPVKMKRLAQITDAGERMPHKSTYFYPKMYTGLTIQKL
ncbi:MAG TPA: DUF1015 domain-containing protein [Sedimentisphaerales bacterium]|nr:DUF1015 domain-containing protein [Sedimentisphaerales bacterium]